MMSDGTTSLEVGTCALEWWTVLPFRDLRLGPKMLSATLTSSLAIGQLWRLIDMLANPLEPCCITMF